MAERIITSDTLSYDEHQRVITDRALSLGEDYITEQMRQLIGQDPNWTAVRGEIFFPLRRAYLTIRPEEAARE